MTRSEEEIFLELQNLATDPHFAHAIAFFCFRDNLAIFAEELTADDLLPRSRQTQLIRNEISTLIGLLAKGPPPSLEPNQTKTQKHIDKVQSLMSELHEAIAKPMFEHFYRYRDQTQLQTPFERADILRETIFYGPESAYTFQYIDLFHQKYEKDEAWFLHKIGLSPEQIQLLAESIEKTLCDQLEKFVDGLRSTDPTEWDLLIPFIVTPEKLSTMTSIEADKIHDFLDTFSTQFENNKYFQNVSDFNHTNAYPFLSIDGQQYFLFQIYNLCEALYETPFFEMISDENFKDQAAKNRGQFLEEFSYRRLTEVFGKNNVFKNIILYDARGDHISEVDVLVIFGDNILLIQAKTKRLTIEARKGNDAKLKEDFSKAIQSAYDQCFACAEAIINRTYSSAISGSDTINIPHQVSRVVPICVVSDHYPALSFQARQFLSYKETEVLKAPLVFDVFTIDIIVEFLDTPLYLLSYMERRSSYRETIFSGHEISILAYHLRRNLWLDDDTDFIHIGDDVAADVDVAMAVRRRGIPGNRTPPGILTKNQGTYFQLIIEQIENSNDTAAINFGFLMLQISGDSISAFNTAVRELIKKYLSDGKTHDASIMFGGAKAGITLHVGYETFENAIARLRNHCVLAKYRHHAEHWYGLVCEPERLRIISGLELSFPWEQDAYLDERLRNSPGFGKLVDFDQRGFMRKKKVGRNDQCPCGSGRKFKKCCIGKFK